MAIRFDRSAVALAAAILLAYASASDAQQPDRDGTAAPQGRPGTAQAPASAQSSLRDLRVSDLIGMDVRNGRGESLGNVQDVVIDAENGRVAYVVLGIGGFLGIGEKLSAFPMSSFKVSQASARGEGAGPTSPPAAGDGGARGDAASSDPQREDTGAAATASRMLSGRGAAGMHLVLDADPQRLKRAPNFDRNQWPDWNDSKYRGEVDRAAGATGAAKVGRLLRGSQLVDADIRDSQNRNVGEVEDLVVDVRTGVVRYAVVDFDRAWTPDDRLVAVPMKALRPAGEKGELVFSGERAQLERAPAFDKGRWPDLNAPAYRAEVDRYVTGWTGARTGTTPGAGTASTPDDRSRGSAASRSGAAGGGSTDPATTPSTPGSSR